ncbi:ROK family protein [Streptomyces avicenniae]|uniref:ROK family protein n=1 Tax=Streptomyces avicenniae TaxID=500153 RepID=UPI00069BDC8B|nr:ROK family protein [Streptomyces avicenniae]
MRRTSRDIRTANRYGILRQAIASSPVSRPLLARATGLSLATVATLVGELLDRGMLVEAGYEDSGGGRPRGLLAVNPRGGALVGVDLTGSAVRVEVVDLALRVLARSREERRRDDGDPARVVGEIVRALRAATDRAGDVRVLGAGLGVPRTLDPAGDRHGVPLLARLGEHVPYRLYLDSPLRACVVAELWFGAARGREDAVVISLGTDVGAGLVLGGTPHRGLSGDAGGWGHTTLEPHGRPCSCGRRGCLEAYVGAPGILRTLRELTGDTAADGAGDADATAVPALAAACRAGDPAALGAVRRTADLLGAGIADLVHLLDPEIVVLTGRVARALGPALLEPLRPAVARHLLPRARPGAQIVLSPLATNPVSLGAATLALEGVLAGAPATGRRRP